MRRVFNLGIGMVAVVPPSAAHRALDVLRTAGHRAVVVGEVVPGHGGVRFTGDG
jgi:phosphoribosylformylglycinamidine cyclo-ligase